MNGLAQRRRVQLGTQETTPCCTDTHHAEGSHLGGSSFGQDFRPYARVRGRATLGVCWDTPAQQRKRLEKMPWAVVLMRTDRSSGDRGGPSWLHSFSGSSSQ